MKLYAVVRPIVNCMAVVRRRNLWFALERGQRADDAAHDCSPRQQSKRRPIGEGEQIFGLRLQFRQGVLGLY